MPCQRMHGLLLFLSAEAHLKECDRLVKDRQQSRLQTGRNILNDQSTQHTRLSFMPQSQNLAQRRRTAS